ncbi:MAG: hypothetical protein IT385_17505 [Deltaproteobacteria bacterium]|nr:hypothetical protein [Deltaproteobacteria bacterium]
MAGLAGRPAILAAAFLVAGCTEWLEVDDGTGDEPILELPVGRPLVLPSASPEAGGRGPIVPATPGLRVPLAGYWTRARLDAADLLLPYTWAALSEGRGQVVFRMEGATSTADDPTAAAGQSLRAVIPITLPPGTDASALAGLTLAGPSLSAATVALRTSAADIWLVEPTRLAFEAVRSEIVVGTIEGVARRGAKGQRARRFEAGFIALRAPEPVGALGPGDGLAPDPAVGVDPAVGPGPSTRP